MESQLRLTAASLIDSLSRLEELERAKRDLEPGSPKQLRLSHEVEALARDVLDAASVQSDLVEELAATKHAGARSPGAGPPREIHLVLAEWRDAERSFSDEVPGTPGWEVARVDVERLRDEYRQAFEAADRG